MPEEEASEQLQEQGNEAGTSLVATYRNALHEVVAQNDSLKARVLQLERQLARAKEELGEKDQAIVELAALLDTLQEGALTEDLKQL